MEDEEGSKVSITGLSNIMKEKIKREYKGKKKWERLWGTGEFLESYKDWTRTGIKRAVRRPSLRAIDWISYSRSMGDFASRGEKRTRFRSVPFGRTKLTPWGVATHRHEYYDFGKCIDDEDDDEPIDYSIPGPADHYNCTPCPYPLTTSGEIGWLLRDKSCSLEIYPSKFKQKPPLLWHMEKISKQMPGTE